MFVGSMFAILGCADDSESARIRSINDRYGIPPDMVDVQVRAINDALVANHPHFTEGRSRSPSLNVDAFDFMVGRQTGSFPDVFDSAGDPIEIEHAELLYGKRLANWMRKIERKHAPNAIDFYILYTRIGLTFGFEGQADYLAIATDNEQVVEWQLDSITAY